MMHFGKIRAPFALLAAGILAGCNNKEPEAVEPDPVPDGPGVYVSRSFTFTKIPSTPPRGSPGRGPRTIVLRNTGTPSATGVVSSATHTPANTARQQNCPRSFFIIVCVLQISPFINGRVLGLVKFTKMYARFRAKPHTH